ncbi:hypothetical protein JOD55_000040 [Arcanobacterium pluranimalium]|uniref:hypothetical protein n=1 Tax=Arcanobacterium pluranimalium TaxID=108028 RepID=UPI00195D4D90|nr:hypothetical protein [Arcanobacterium pluranimalium]MBM7824213.1 hypothetical protein [Arcanobacterium pluranimalium]
MPRNITNDDRATVEVRVCVEVLSVVEVLAAGVVCVALVAALVDAADGVEMRAGVCDDVRCGSFKERERSARGLRRGKNGTSPAA